MRRRLMAAGSADRCTSACSALQQQVTDLKKRLAAIESQQQENTANFPIVKRDGKLELEKDLLTRVYNRSCEKLRENELRWHAQFQELDNKMNVTTKRMARLESVISMTASTTQQVELLTKSFSRYVEQSKINDTSATQELDQKIQRLSNKIGKNSLCSGIQAWKYYPLEDWSDNRDNTALKDVPYEKKRNDTILRVSFHSNLAQGRNRGCSQWHIHFNGTDCTDPAPIVSTIYRLHNGSNLTDVYFWNIAPAEITGFCNATEYVSLQPANTFLISVVVRPCSVRNVQLARAGDTHSGRPWQGSKVRTAFGKTTSSFLVEEYCLP